MLSDSDLALRKGRVTASTVSAFLGFHRYQSPSSAWELHTGRREFEMNDDVRLGQFLEPGLVRAVTTRLGWSRDQYEYPCPTQVEGWMAATPDILNVAPMIGGVQIKNQNPHMARTYLGTPGSVGPSDNTLLPAYMLGQVQWEMLVVGSPRWYLATYLGGRDLRIYRIWRDDVMINRLEARAFEFWKRHLDPDGPQERPSDANWNPGVGHKQRPRKLKGAELLNQPTPGVKK